MALPDLKPIAEELERRDAEREAVIKDSRTVLKASKRAIFYAHENKTEEAEQKLQEAKDAKNALEREHDTTGIGAFRDAVEEYAEAVMVLSHAKEEDIPGPQELGVDVEEWLSGLSDFVGELSRTARFAAIERDEKKVQSILSLARKVQEGMLSLNVRGNLRKKQDAVKHHLQRIEQAQYDLSLSQ